MHMRVSPTYPSHAPPKKWQPIRAASPHSPAIHAPGSRKPPTTASASANTHFSLVHDVLRDMGLPPCVEQLAPAADPSRITSPSNRLPTATTVWYR